MSVNVRSGMRGRAGSGYGPGMTDPHDDLSTVADPGSMDLDSMTEPDNDNPGDLDADHEHLAMGDRPGPSLGGAAGQSGQGSPVGPPD